MSFKHFQNEMAIEKGTYSKNTFKSNDWDYYNTKGKKFIKLVKDRLGSGHYKVFKTKNIYFLVSENEEYLGHIQYDKSKDIVNIESSHSELKYGFYIIMFTVIFSDRVKEIRSDTSLSREAFKSYDNLNKNKSFNLAIFDNGKYIKFNYDNLFLPRNNSRVISVRSENIDFIFETYYDKISNNAKNFNEHTENLLPYKKMYEDYSRETDMALYGCYLDEQG